MRTGLWRFALVAFALALLGCGSVATGVVPPDGVAYGPAEPGDPVSPDLDRRVAGHLSLLSVRWPSELRAVAVAGERLIVLFPEGFGLAWVSPQSGISPDMEHEFAPEAAIADAVAMDATNGQSVYVAETDRVTLVSEDGRRLLAFDVDSIDRPAVGAPEAHAPGEAVGVAAGPDGTVFVSEATRNVIQVWKSGRVADVIGGLGQPKALAVSGRRLFVVDSASGDVRVLDTSGTPLETWEASDIGGAVNVSVEGDAILLVGESGAALVRSDGSRLWRVDIESDEPLIDATIHRGWLVATTRRGLTLLGRVPPEAP